MGGHTGQPLSVQGLAPSRLHSHVKNARVQAGDGSLRRGAGAVGEEAGVVNSRTLLSPSSVQPKQVALARRGRLGRELAGVGAGL